MSPELRPQARPWLTEAHAFEDCAPPSTTGRECTWPGRNGSLRSPVNGAGRGWMRPELRPRPAADAT